MIHLLLLHLTSLPAGSLHLWGVWDFGIEVKSKMYVGGVGRRSMRWFEVAIFIITKGYTRNTNVYCTKSLLFTRESIIQTPFGGGDRLQEIRSSIFVIFSNSLSFDKSKVMPILLWYLLHMLSHAKVDYIIHNSAMFNYASSSLVTLVSED